MRKMFLLLSALFLVFALAACGDSDGGDASSGDVSEVKFFEVEGFVDLVLPADFSAAATGIGTVEIINPETGENLTTETIIDESGRFTANFTLETLGDQFAILFVANIQVDGEQKELRNLSFFDLTDESGTLAIKTAKVTIIIDVDSTALANEVLGEGVNTFPTGEGYSSMLTKYKAAGGYAFSFKTGNIELVGQVGGEPGAEEPVETVGDTDPVKFSVYDDGHQKVYNSTEDTSFKAIITDIYTTDNETTVRISVTKDEKPYAGSFPGWEFSLNWTAYDNGTGTYTENAKPDSTLTPVSNNDGTFDITFSPAVEMQDNMIFYLGGVRAEEYESNTHNYLGVSDYVNAVYVKGEVPAVQADPDGCDNCHMKNILKHGYISTRPIDQNGTVKPFLNCVVCHNNGRPSHDGTPADALNLNGDNTTDSTLRNTVHAYHVYAKYPQSMSNCVTCHTDGQLEYVVSNAFKDYDTCQTCHGDLLSEYGGNFRPPHNGENFKTRNCYSCHEEGNRPGRPTYRELHNGGYSFSKYYYNPDNDTAVRWSERVKFQIDNITYNNGLLIVNWRALVDNQTYNLNNNYTTAKNIDFGTDNLTDLRGAYVLVGYLGFGSKDVVAYVRANTSINGDGTATSTLTLNNTTLTEYDVKAVKVGILGAPAYKGSATLNDSRHIAVTNITTNFNLETLKQEGVSLTVSKEKCDSCHNELIMHDSGPTRYDAVGNPDSCMFCHNPASFFSHYLDGSTTPTCLFCHNSSHNISVGRFGEQSRALDAYIHAYHEGQPLVNGHTMDEYPAGSMANCEKCHIKGFTIPNQIDDLGAYQRGKTGGYDGITTGPAAEACGSCHKASMISKGNDTASINSHFSVMGYYEPTLNRNVYKTVMQKVKSGEIVGESCSICHNKP